jgi:uncharacterized protein YndB with AHSA1/START domain
MTDPDTSTQDVLTLAQRVAAPPEAVFDFFVDPEKIVRWMGTAVDIEPEPGGKFWLNVNGTDIAAGTYLEVDPPRRVVFTWGWEGSGDVPPGSSTVTVTLRPDGDHTTVELRHGGLPGGAEDEHGKGWTHYLGRLVDAVEGRDPGPDSHRTDQDEPD